LVRLTDGGEMTQQATTAERMLPRRLDLPDETALLFLRQRCRRLVGKERAYSILPESVFVIQLIDKLGSQQFLQRRIENCFFELHVGTSKPIELICFLLCSADVVLLEPIQKA
jgi:hypothetical protein